MHNTLLVSICSSAILFAAPVVAARFVRFSGLPSIISFSFFLVLQLLVFAVIAAVFGSYVISFPLAALLVCASGFSVNQRAGSRDIAAEDRQIPRSSYEILPWFVAAVIFLGYLAIRAQYSYINFNNNGDEAGVEKLFNLSLQQSFLFGEGYPPQWIWLSGEPIRYYVLLKSIPGLASWIANALFGNAGTGGVLFILSEAFFAALPSGLLFGWVLWFGRGAKCRGAVCAAGAVLAFFCFLGTHFQAISLGLRALLEGSSLDWWQLSREVVPYTDNQYPIWLMILGDNHAYMQVYFLQILFWGAVLSLVLLERLSIPVATAVGTLAAALVLSHPGSVLVNLSILGAFMPFVLLHFIRQGWRDRIRLVAVHGAIATAVMAAFLVLLYSPVGAVKIVSPPRELASHFGAFLNLNFSVVLWSAMLLAIPAVFGEAARNLLRNLSANLVVICASILGVFIFYFFSLPAIALMTVFGCLAYLALYGERVSKSERILSLFAVASFAIWLPPEIVAFDHVIDNRTDWIRFQMGLRFWPEGYILIPFALTLAVIQRIGERPIPRSWLLGASGVLLVLVAAHIPGISNRISRSQQSSAELDGFAEFARRYPSDDAIVSYLRSLPADQHVVIAESCGIGDPRVPQHFAWPGRIAAFSGRAGICGWARHAVLYNNPLLQIGFKGVSVEDRTSTFLRAYSGFFEHVSANERDQAYLDLATLRALGVTHIVFGQFEKGLFSQFSIENAAATLPVSLVLGGPDGTGILKINE